MKNLIFSILLSGFCVGVVLPLAAAPHPSPIDCPVPGTLSPATVNKVLEKAAVKIGVSKTVLERAYQCGTCLVKEVRAGVYRVSYNGGIWELVLDQLD